MNKLRILMTKIFDWQTIPFVFITFTVVGLSWLFVQVFIAQWQWWLIGSVAIATVFMYYAYFFKILPIMIPFWRGGWNNNKKEEFSINF